MKFYCDACNIKYAIADDKVRGKILKVRCKNCGNVITVREAVAPIAAEGLLAETDPTISTPTHLPLPHELAVPTTNWYYALNGQTFGPFTLEGLRRKYATAEIGDATYVWHERLGSWKPVANEPAFEQALALGHKIVPSRKTLGFTGPVEAIRIVHGGPNTQRAGAVPNAAHAAQKPAVRAQEPQPQPQPQARPKPKPQPQPPTRPEPKPVRRESLPLPAKHPRRHTPDPVPTPEARPLNEVRKANLDKLRQKLGASLDATDEDARIDESLEPLPQPVAGEAIFTYASGIVPASAESSQDIKTALAADAVDFDIPARKAAKLSPSSRSDILDRVVGPIEQPPDALSEASEVDDSGVIPFFTEGPMLPSSIKGRMGQDATSESLMLDVEGMNRRKRTLGVGIVAGVAVFAVLAAIVAFAFRDTTPKPVAEVGAEEATKQPEHKDDLVIPTYGEEEIGKMATLNLEEEIIFEDDEVEEVTVAAIAESDAVTGEPPSNAGTKQRSTKTPEAGIKREEVPPQEPEQVDMLSALLQPRAGRQTEIKAPEDKLLVKQTEGLTKDQARRGFQKVKLSIRDCRERHNRYNAKLAAGKLKVSLTVSPNGRVQSFTLNPRSVQNTEFSACMESHQGRWLFAAFKGDPVRIETSVIIQ